MFWAWKRTPIGALSLLQPTKTTMAKKSVDMQPLSKILPIKHCDIQPALSRLQVCSWCKRRIAQSELNGDQMDMLPNTTLVTQLDIVSNGIGDILNQESGSISHFIIHKSFLHTTVYVKMSKQVEHQNHTKVHGLVTQ